MKTSEFTDYLKTRRFSHQTIKSRITAINIYLRWVNQTNMEPDQITYQDLLEYMEYCNKQGLAQRTVQHYLQTIKHYYDHLEAQNLITTHPVTGIEVKGIKRNSLHSTLEPHELHQLYNQYPGESLSDKRNKVMLGLLVYQGIRTEELNKLTTHEVKLREGKIDIPGSKQHNGRLLALESHQVMDMYDYLLQVRSELLQMNPKRKSQQRIATDQLFIGQGGHCYSMNNFMTQLMHKVKKVNPKVQKPQQIRASVITKWVKMYNLRKAQYLAGHRYISSTESYLKNDVDGLKEEVQQFHPLG